MSTDTAGQARPANHDLDLLAIFAASEAAYSYLAQDRAELPASVREHFTRNVPALVSLVKRLDDELAQACGDLANLRRHLTKQDVVKEAAAHV